MVRSKTETVEDLAAIFPQFSSQIQSLKFTTISSILDLKLKHFSLFPPVSVHQSIQSIVVFRNLNPPIF
ncbi:hypothetical protein L6452_23609 [Arctium lappa]|uniref:Uncharacterized protein n=1 Tax=Arctium lappa TaxID=4217 RepID=A0ACB9B1G6_ARCLA|nr:hypothetical protein L6452_23609 [Arctium lappa]